MNEILAVEEDPNTSLLVIEDEEEALPTQAQEDFDASRETLQEFIQMGKEALETSLALLKESESPRCIEVFATLLKTVSDLNMGMVDIHKKKEGYVAPVATSNNQQLALPTTDNSSNLTQNVFLGSTEDLARMIAEIENTRNLKTIN